MDANSGEPWSEMDVADLTHSLDYWDTFAQTASFLCRDEDEGRQKARQLGGLSTPAGASRSFVKANPKQHYERSRSWRQTSRSGTQQIHLALSKDDKLDVFAFESITRARRWRGAHKVEEG
jgi:hypothetical protein